MRKRTLRARRNRRINRAKLAIGVAFGIYVAGTVFAADAQVHANLKTSTVIVAERNAGLSTLERRHGDCHYRYRSGIGGDLSAVAECQDGSVWAFSADDGWRVWNGCAMPLYPGEMRPGWRTSLNLSECYGETEVSQ